MKESKLIQSGQNGYRLIKLYRWEPIETVTAEPSNPLSKLLGNHQASLNSNTHHKTQVSETKYVVLTEVEKSISQIPGGLNHV